MAPSGKILAQVPPGPKCLVSCLKTQVAGVQISSQVLGPRSRSQVIDPKSCFPAVVLGPRSQVPAHKSHVPAPVARSRLLGPWVAHSILPFIFYITHLTPHSVHLTALQYYSGQGSTFQIHVPSPQLRVQKLHVHFLSPKSEVPRKRSASTSKQTTKC